jgi:phosphohistidine swiveling domain-containing protein
MVNTVRVIILGTVLARSSSGGFANPDITRIQGRIVSCDTPNDAPEKIVTTGEEILSCRVLTKDHIPILRIVKGVICEEVSEITDAELQEINPNLVWLTHIRNTTENLETGLVVTIDAKELLVYEGSI